MPYSEKGDSGMTPLRYSQQEWDKEIDKFVQGEDMDKDVIAKVYEDGGFAVQFWTNKWAVELRSKTEDSYNGSFDSVDFEMLERNPPSLTM